MRHSHRIGGHRGMLYIPRDLPLYQGLKFRRHLAQKPRRIQMLVGDLRQLVQTRAVLSGQRAGDRFVDQQAALPIERDPFPDFHHAACSGAFAWIVIVPSALRTRASTSTFCIASSTFLATTKSISLVRRARTISRASEATLNPASCRTT